jgi:hypothetical protein
MTPKCVATPFLLWLQRLLGEHEEVHLSALGMAVSTMVSIAEILKKDGLAVETSKHNAAAHSSWAAAHSLLDALQSEVGNVCAAPRCGATVCLRS